MITLYREDPPRVTLRPDRYPIDTEHAAGLLLGFVYEKGALMGLIMLGDGVVTLLPAKAWTLNWRYEVENDQFIDLDALKEEQGS